MPILDASFMIDVQRDVPGAVAILNAMVDADEELLVPAQVAIEFMAGVPDATHAWKRITAAFSILDLDREQMIAAAELGRTTRAEGTFAGWADVQIAAAARMQSTWVLTADGTDFARMRVDHWDYRRGKGPITYDEQGP